MKVVESLLAQLAWQRLSVSATTEELMNRYERGSRPTLHQLQASLQRELSTYQNVYMILDALDEFHEESCQKLVNILRGFPRVNVLITSRDLPRLSSIFVQDIHLFIKAAENDIRQYVAERVEQCADLLDLIHRNPSLQGEVIEGVVENAQGM
jgi:hypothetical protein